MGARRFAYFIIINYLFKEFYLEALFLYLI
jgi:hypothetical protein